MLNLRVRIIWLVGRFKLQDLYMENTTFFYRRKRNEFSVCSGMHQLATDARNKADALESGSSCCSSSMSSTSSTCSGSTSGSTYTNSDSWSEHSSDSSCSTCSDGSGNLNQIIPNIPTGCSVESGYFGNDIRTININLWYL